MPCDAALDIMTTCVSPRALATMSAPSMPPAPGLFSTTIGWPSRLPKYSAKVRDRMSAAPAGGKLTIQRIGFDGQGVCAAAMPGAASGGENREATARQHGRSLEGYERQDAYCNMRAGHWPIAKRVGDGFRSCATRRASSRQPAGSARHRHRREGRAHRRHRPRARRQRRRRRRRRAAGWSARASSRRTSISTSPASSDAATTRRSASRTWRWSGSRPSSTPSRSRT